MNKREKELLEKIYKDCEKLERHRDLTEYGAGQGDLCIRLINKKRKAFKWQRN